MTLAGSCTASCLRHGPSAADSSRPRGRGDGLGQQHTAGLTEPPRLARASQRDGQRTAQRQLRVARQPREVITVVVPLGDAASHAQPRWWRTLWKSQMATLLRMALPVEIGIVIIDVPYEISYARCDRPSLTAGHRHAAETSS